MGEETQSDVKDINSMLDFNDESEEKVEQETTSEESSTEQKSPETDKHTETEGEESQADAEEEKPEETEVSESDKVSKADERKEQLNKEIRDLVAQRNSLKRDVELATYDKYRAATAEQLEQQGMDATEAKIEALRQEQQLAQYTAHVTELNSNIEMESMQAIHDFPVFDTKSPEYDKEFAESVAQEYMRVSGIQSDPNTGFIVNASVLPYQFYKSYADAYKRASERGEVRAKKAAEKTYAAAESPSSSAPKKENSDPLMAALLKDD